MTAQATPTRHFPLGAGAPAGGGETGRRVRHPGGKSELVLTSNL